MFDGSVPVYQTHTSVGIFGSGLQKLWHWLEVFNFFKSEITKWAEGLRGDAEISYIFFCLYAFFKKFF